VIACSEKGGRKAVADSMDGKHVLVCVTGQKTCEKLIAEGGRLAEEMGAGLSVVHVARQGTGLLGGLVAEAEALEYLFKVSTEYGADMAVIRSENVIETLANHAEKVGANLMVLGSSREVNRDVTKDLKARIPNMDFRIVYAEE